MREDKTAAPTQRHSDGVSTVAPLGRTRSGSSVNTWSRAQRKVQEAIDGSPRQLAQRVSLDWGLSPAMLVQRQRLDATFGSAILQRQGDAPSRGAGGLPEPLKSGIESLSGLSMEDVRVHHDSAQPARIGAMAYAQDNDIHLGPGQEQHLPHEAWHVVQQRQGRVTPTTEIGGKAVNDAPDLESEADRMGTVAAAGHHPGPVQASGLFRRSSGSRGVLQGMFYEYYPDGATADEQHIWHNGPVIPWFWEQKKSTVDGSPEQYKGYGVWLRKGTTAYFQQTLRDVTPPQLQQGYQEVTEIVTDLKEKLTENTRVAQVIGNRLDSREAVHEQLVQVKDLVEVYQNELKRAMQRYASIGVIALGLSAGISALLAHYLSLPQIPWQVKATIDIVGVLYGAYVTHRWMTTDLLPVLARALLVTLNSLNWTSTVYLLIADALNGSAFQTVHIAALPCALTIELILRRIMANVEAKIKKDESSPLLGAEQV